ncbi:MAG: DNA mismatch repair protein MutS [Candidatus Hydrogenedentes bacterium]|nr:DNA mismatch repair protein MutS [Candidatus Hydrogenedentota bacterium]
MENTHPRSEYQQRLAAREAMVRTLAGRESLVANLRLIVFALGLIIAWAALWMHWIPWQVIGLPIAAFVALALWHDRILRARANARLAVAHYQRCLARVEDRWAGTGIPGDELLPEHHPYAVDLDLFGRGSLFELLCTARTRAGERTLAAWLTAPADAAMVRSRQEALQEMRDRLDLGEELSLLGSDVNRGVLPEVLVKWAEAPQTFTTNTPRRIAFVVGAYNLLALAAWIALETGPSPLLLGMIVAVLAERITGNRAHRVVESVSEPCRELDVLARVLARLEREPFTHGRLRDVQASLVSDGARASECIARLDRLVTWHESRQNQLFIPIALMTMWDVHFAYAFERWRARYGGSVRRWLEALGELEALVSLAAYHYEHPEDPFPEIVETGAEFDGVDIGHPLLGATGVRNTLRLDNKSRIYIVSGSNMSGKSTLLRTVGINTVLALAGAPVCAASLRVTPMKIGATLRVQDSIQTGDSRFYAEIRRLHQLSLLATGPMPLLFLLDEILHGTNSHDRKIGAEAVLRSFIEAGGIGLVTTHDLALTSSADHLPDAVNVHFEDHIKDGQLAFDYRMRPGVVQKSNALELMRRIGLPI